MIRRIVLVGPPGVGKSSLVRLAREKSINAIDIEDVHSETKKLFIDTRGEEDKDAITREVDEKILNFVNNSPEGVTIFGAGGYGSHFPRNMIEKILLLPPKEVARERFLDRDANDPDKKAQNQEFDRIYDGFVHLWKDENRYDRVIEDVLTPEETLNIIIG